MKVMEENRMKSEKNDEIKRFGRKFYDYLEEWKEKNEGEQEIKRIDMLKRQSKWNTSETHVGLI